MSALSDAELSKFSKLFAALSPEGRTALMARSSKQSFAEREVICVEGEEARDFFVITRGRVRITVDDLGERKEVGLLSAGQFFGELALLSGKKREATVEAVEAVELVAFPIAAVQAVLEASPEARAVLQKVGLAREEETIERLMS